MGRLVLFTGMFCIFLGGCCNVERQAEARTESPGGEILGVVADFGARATVTLGPEGPTVPVDRQGYFTFSNVAPGCYDVRFHEEGRAPLTLDGARTCVDVGESVVLSVIFGRI